MVYDFRKIGLEFCSETAVFAWIPDWTRIRKVFLDPPLYYCWDLYFQKYLRCLAIKRTIRIEYEFPLWSNSPVSSESLKLIQLIRSKAVLKLKSQLRNVALPFMATTKFRIPHVHTLTWDFYEMTILGLNRFLDSCSQSMIPERLNNEILKHI